MKVFSFIGLFKVGLKKNCATVPLLQGAEILQKKEDSSNITFTVQQVGAKMRPFNELLCLATSAMF